MLMIVILVIATTLMAQTKATGFSVYKVDGMDFFISIDILNWFFWLLIFNLIKRKVRNENVIKRKVS